MIWNYLVILYLKLLKTDNMVYECITDFKAVHSNNYYYSAGQRISQEVYNSLIIMEQVNFAEEWRPSFTESLILERIDGRTFTKLSL